jgi:hypothetical protein
MGAADTLRHKPRRIDAIGRGDCSFRLDYVTSVFRRRLETRPRMQANPCWNEVTVQQLWEHRLESDQQD